MYDEIGFIYGGIVGLWWILNDGEYSFPARWVKSRTNASGLLSVRQHAYSSRCRKWQNTGVGLTTKTSHEAA